VGLDWCVVVVARDEVARHCGNSRARHLLAEIRARFVRLLWHSAGLFRMLECVRGADDTHGARGAVVRKFREWPPLVVVTAVTTKHGH